MKLRLGTRGSDLARTQSGHVAAALADAGIETELVVITTSGDRSRAPSFGAIGPQGVFVREIEQALSDRQIDIAVHSYKDLPTRSPPDLIVAAVPARVDPADWLFVRQDRTDKTSEPTPREPSPSDPAPREDRPPEAFARDRRRPGMAGAEPQGRSSGASRAKASGGLSGLPPKASVGTSSARRQSWLRHYRPDLEIRPLRGNVPTRLGRLANGDFDAILLAGAGIERLADVAGLLDDALETIERRRLDPEIFVPAPAQGALAVQCRAGDPAIREALATIDDAATRAAVETERAALALAEGGCDTAFGAFARQSGRGFELTVMLERAGRVLTAGVTGAAGADLAARAMAALDAATDRSIG